MQKVKDSVIHRPARKLAAPKRSGLESELYVQHELVRAVMERRLKPGAKLDEDVLAEVFNISRTRLRKVLSLLGTQLILTHKPNFGTFVAKPSPGEAREVFEARHGIEEILVRIVGKKRSKLEFAPLRRLVTEEQRAYQTKKAGAIELSGDFHLVLAELSGNSVLKGYLQQLVIRTILVQALYSPGHLCLVHEHEEIMESLERGDIKSATKRMSLHLQSIQNHCVFREVDEEAADLREIFRYSR